MRLTKNQRPGRWLQMFRLENLRQPCQQPIMVAKDIRAASIGRKIMSLPLIRNDTPKTKDTVSADRASTRNAGRLTILIWLTVN